MKTLWKKGHRSLRWSVEDDNGDELRYRLAFRPEAAAGNGAGPEGAADGWLPMAGDLEDDHFGFDSTALPDGALLLNPPWVDREDLLGHELVPVPKDEPHAANVVCIGERVVMSAAYPRTADIVRKRGFKVEVVDLSEFAKGEGCGTCLSLIFSG